MMFVSRLSRCLRTFPILCRTASCGVRVATLSLALALCLAAQPSLAAAQFELQPGGRICIIGNAQAERLQHFGYFETALHRAFPQHELVVRNLGWSADELTLKPRSQNFGSQDDYLRREKADVILAFFGFNESFAGPAGLAKFKQDLTKFIHHARGQKYNGESAPRLALISPLAHENLGDPHLPSGEARNEVLKLYTQAMADVAAAEKVPFANVFQPSEALMKQAAAQGQPLTINGIHLNDLGSQKMGPALMQALFGDKVGQDVVASDSPLRAAVNDKNLHFWYHYRAVNGFYIYGGRSPLWDNVKVMEVERQKIADMVSLRDRVVWDLAQGKAPQPIDDTQTTPLMKVETNFHREIEYLTPEDQIKTFNIPEGFVVELFASEREFPELKNPVQMAFDAHGRLWVCTMPSYPQYQPPSEVNDKLLIFEDTDGDGRADKRTVFADGLHVPTGFELGHDGVYLAQQPNLMFLKDTDGDDVADERTIILHGFDSADSHHSISAFTWGPGGALYFQEGTFHHSQIETPHGPVRVKNAGVFRYEPKSEKLDVFVSYPFANPWGHIFDAWGQNFVADASGGSNYFAAAFSGHVEYPRKHRRMNEFFRREFRPTAGCEIVSSRNFPAEMQGDYLLNNCIGFRGIGRYKFKEDGSGLAATTQGPLLQSDDPNFRPVDLEFGPDGALYFVDWYNPLIGHMQHSLRDPKRDHRHGRIWRLRNTKQPLTEPAKIAGATIWELIDLLSAPELRTRYRARRELAQRDEQEVADALVHWATTLSGSTLKKGVYQDQLEALWMHQTIDVVNETLLREVLRSPDPRARAAATRVLCYWRDRIDSAIELLTIQAGDRHPRVRLEAVRAASFFKDPRATEIVLESLVHPQDYYLEYTTGETLTTLRDFEFGLVGLLKSGRLPTERIPFVIRLAAKRGNSDDLGYLFDLAVADDSLSVEARRAALEGLREAVRYRNVRPNADYRPLADLILRLRDDNRKPALMAALKLIGLLRVRAAEPQLIELALDDQLAGAIRRAALDVLVGFNSNRGRAAIVKLTSPDRPLAERYMAIGVLTRVDVAEAARRAGQALTEADGATDPARLIQAFLQRPEGVKQLAAALEGVELDQDVAKLALRAMYAVGRSDAELTSMLTKAAGIQTQAAELSDEEVAKLESAVRNSGDPARGEQVFRRADLSCMNCHALGGVGGGVGPELTAVGSSSPVKYLINAILLPDKEVKEEFRMAHVYTADGRALKGIIHEDGEDRLVLKDATGRRTAIAKADIDDREDGGSLMPKGLVQFMTQRELVDLVRFLSELGRDESYKVRNTPTVRRWRVLAEVDSELTREVPNEEVFTDKVLELDGSSWRAAYSMTGGTLPLDESVAPADQDVLYLQFEIDVDFAGQLDIIADSPAGLTMWADDVQLDFAEREPKTVGDFAEGRHRITIRVDRTRRDTDTLRIDLRRIEGSRTRARLVAGV
ncbi:MAG: hypothetical protein DWQ31_14335 [Planctomycetota bacterium]|nr:MAG: hypothetical protein DWQ31_14335 [Planctomycetota bacterium]REJ94547.1 MAG: hypothetical protein DWQ35_08040 [Planctomycetota bacterium]